MQVQVIGYLYSSIFILLVLSLRYPESIRYKLAAIDVDDKSKLELNWLLAVLSDQE